MYIAGDLVKDKLEFQCRERLQEDFYLLLTAAKLAWGAEEAHAQTFQCRERLHEDFSLGPGCSMSHGTSAARFNAANGCSGISTR